MGSDGTVAGTSILKDIAPGSAGISINGGDDFDTPDGRELILYFFDGTHGYEPWITDGTSAGTFLSKISIQVAIVIRTTSATG